jgi:hypothetical protein
LVIRYLLSGNRNLCSGKKESYKSFEELDWLALLDINAEALCRNVSGQPKVDHRLSNRFYPTG